MTKYAELPNGKMLKFPDTVSEKDMQRAVRRELGLQADDLIDSLEKAVAALDKHDEGPAIKLKAAVEALSEALSANSSALSKELSGAIKDIEKAQGKLSSEFVKAMSGQTNLVGKLQASIESLNKTLDAALGQSLEALDRSAELSAKVARDIDSSAKRLEVVAVNLGKTVDAMKAAKHVRKRAVRNRDGSWTLEATN